eukprot:m.84394 g.84394  ORF g.84394 m.84394 type:complete len:344 (+) comp14802_c0_seq1:278-1309(+)
MASADAPQLKRQGTKRGVMKRLFSFSKSKSPRMSTSTFNGTDDHIEEDVEMVPHMDIGYATDLGFHHEKNEDKSNVLPDLLAIVDDSADGLEYRGTPTRNISLFSVFDGHGGDRCSTFAKKQLHQLLAEMLFKGNYDDLVGSALHHSFKQTESQFWDLAKAERDTSGSCSTCVVIKGNKVFCGNAGDSKAMLVIPDKKSPAKCGKKIDLNERHGTELKSERQRIKAAGGRIAPDGSVYGVLFPTRGFGDIDVKGDGKPVVIAVPNGVGIDPQPPVVLDPSQTTYLIVASDGLWDFVSDDAVAAMILRQPPRNEDQTAEALVREARMGGSEDDITIIVVKITFP